MTPQEITPQLRQWIIDQAAAGFNPEAVLKAMVASGWTEDVAIAALESTLQAHVQTLQTQTQTRAQTPEQAPEQVLPPSVPVPDSRSTKRAPVSNRMRTPCARLTEPSTGS